MSYVQTQALFSQDMATQQTPPTPQTRRTQGETGYTIPVHCGLMTLVSDLNKVQIEIKSAAGDVKTITGSVHLKDPIEDITSQLQELKDKLTGIPMSNILKDTETHKANASQMHMENKSLKAQVKDLTRELKEAKQTLAALTQEEEEKDMSQEES